MAAPASAGAHTVTNPVRDRGSVPTKGKSGAKLVLLGTSGGPWPSPTRSGISQVVLVNGSAYVVDCGSGVARQLARSGVGLRSLRSVFLTHLHSDHDADYFNLFLLGWSGLQIRQAAIHAYGPGPAGGEAALPKGEPGNPAPLINPSNPTPGLADITHYQIQAHSYDLNIRMREAGRHDLTQLVVPHEIMLPPELGARAPDSVAPAMEPIEVMEDENVKVSAVLVHHGSLFPSFAYRFDFAQRSIVISGDTSPCRNLVRLAQDCDILVHEVFDAEYMTQSLERIPQADAMLQHVFDAHTSLDDVGRVATDANVGTLVLSHLIPGNDGVSEHRWLSGARANFAGRVVVGSDLLEFEL